MKYLLNLFLAGAFVASSACAAEVKKDAPKAEPEVKIVCLDVQGKDGKPVIDPKTNKPKQNCTKVKIRKKFEGTAIPDKKK